MAHKNAARFAELTQEALGVALGPDVALVSVTGVADDDVKASLFTAKYVFEVELTFNVGERELDSEDEDLRQGAIVTAAAITRDVGVDFMRLTAAMSTATPDLFTRDEEEVSEDVHEEVSEEAG